MDKKRILVVDDDPAVLRLLSPNLRTRGYEVALATDGEQCLSIACKEQVDLVLLDLMLPGLDGMEVCRHLRSRSLVPIIVLSARGDERAKVRCLELGADDYLTKPFGMAELMARVKAALRRHESTRTGTASPSFACGDVEVDFAQRRVMLDGAEIRLTPKEYSLLQYLVLNAGKVLTHTMLLEAIWGMQYRSEKEYLRVFVGRLRKKLGDDPDRPRYILTDTGVGYHFAPLL